MKSFFDLISLANINSWNVLFYEFHLFSYSILSIILLYKHLTLKDVIAYLTSLLDLRYAFRHHSPYAKNLLNDSVHE